MKFKKSRVSKRKRIIEANENDYINALAEFLECDPEDIFEEDYDHYGLPVFSCSVEKYAIGTDEEADDACEQYIRENIWAFDSRFIGGVTGVCSDMIRCYQKQYAEDANDCLLDLIENTCGLARFVADAIAADGRGHFLAEYDGEENEIKYNGKFFFIYRVY